MSRVPACHHCDLGLPPGTSVLRRFVELARLTEARGAPQRWRRCLVDFRPHRPRSRDQKTGLLRPATRFRLRISLFRLPACAKVAIRGLSSLPQADSRINANCTSNLFLFASYLSQVRPIAQLWLNLLDPTASERDCWYAVVWDETTECASRSASWVSYPKASPMRFLHSLLMAPHNQYALQRTESRDPSICCPPGGNYCLLACTHP